MKIQTDYITRDLYYTTSEENWKDQIPNDNWCLILISSSENEQLIDRIISKSITNNVGYICGIGTKHNYIHDQADCEFVIRDIGESNSPKPKYHIMTVGDEELDEGLWFGLNLTFQDDVEITKIHIIDTDCKWKEQIKLLITKYNEGYIPDEK